MSEKKPKAPAAALPRVADAVVEAHIQDSQMPASMQSTYRTAMRSRSRRAAMKAFCLECQGYDRRGVSECGAAHCPLWRFRPFQGAA